eukprot:13530058-Ditylum_brightwellii.AAC.1
MACEPTPSKVLLEVQGNNVYKLTTKKDTIEFYHAACFSPIKSTWKKAVQAGFFATWPRLTPELIEKYL